MKLSKNVYTIEKNRYKIKISEKLIAEVDVYYKELDGLITIEVEFSSEEEAREFIPPKWFGKKLDKNMFSNSVLANMDNSKLKEMLGKEEILKNTSIKKHFENKYKEY